jgi:hypothetical protein
MKRILALIALAAVALLWLTRREPEVWEEEEVQPWDCRTVMLATPAWSTWRSDLGRAH